LGNSIFKYNVFLCEGINEGTGIQVITIDTEMISPERIKGNQDDTMGGFGVSR
jgi:hypothetical protein